MKLTESKLREIIQEELTSLNEASISETNKDIQSLMTKLNFKLSESSYTALDNINAFLLSEIQGVGEHGKGNSKMKEALSILNKFSKMKDFTNPSDELVKEVKDGIYKR